MTSTKNEGAFITKLLKNSGAKMYHVANRMGYSREYVNRVLKKEEIPDDFIRKVASAVGVEGSELIKAVREANDEYQIIMNVPGVKDRIGEGAQGSQSMEDILEENARLRKENKELLAKVMQLIDLLDKK